MKVTFSDDHINFFKIAKKQSKSNYSLWISYLFSLLLLSYPIFVSWDKWLFLVVCVCACVCRRTVLFVSCLINYDDSRNLCGICTQLFKSFNLPFESPFHSITAATTSIIAYNITAVGRHTYVVQTWRPISTFILCVLDICAKGCHLCIGGHLGGGWIKELKNSVSENFAV